MKNLVIPFMYVLGLCMGYRLSTPTKDVKTVSIPVPQNDSIFWKPLGFNDTAIQYILCDRISGKPYHFHAQGIASFANNDSTQFVVSKEFVEGDRVTYLLTANRKR